MTVSRTSRTSEDYYDLHPRVIPTWRPIRMLTALNDSDKQLKKDGPFCLYQPHATRYQRFSPFAQPPFSYVGDELSSAFGLHYSLASFAYHPTWYEGTVVLHLQMVRRYYLS